VARWSSAAIGLACWCVSAAADWTPVGAGDYIAAAYADKESIRRTGPLAKMSGMYDFRRQDFTPAGKGLFSTVVLREYDCGQRRVRLLSSIDFAGAMATGEVVDTSDRAGRWESIVAGALDEAFWNIACKAD
jgi:hypothetical protein